MPKKSKIVAAAAEPEPVPVVVVEEEPTPVVVDAEKPKKKRIKKEKVVAVEPVPDPEPAQEEEVVVVPDAIEAEAELVEEEAVAVAEPVAEVEKKKRRLVSKETFVKDAEEMQQEILPLLEGNKKLTKAFKLLMADAFRLLRIKTHQKKPKDPANSGFMRPVKPSPVLEGFLERVGEDTTKPLTRAHLTTVICKYIKDHDLQNPKDRRIIFPDDEFKKLFQITENETEPLTYYNIQKRIQTHVSRLE